MTPSTGPGTRQASFGERIDISRRTFRRPAADAMTC